MDNIINTTYTKILKETKSILEKYTQETDIENNRITIENDTLTFIKAEIINYISNLNDTNYNPSLLVDTKKIGNNAHHTLKFCSTIDNETRLYVEYPNILIENTKKQINVIKDAKTSIYDLLSWHNYTDLENMFNAMIEHQQSLFDYYKTAIALSHYPFAKKSEIEYNNLSSLEKKHYQRGYIVAYTQELMFKPLSELLEHYDIDFINSFLTNVELIYKNKRS